MNMVDKIWDWWKGFVINHFWKIYIVCLSTFSIDHIVYGPEPVNTFFIGVCLSMMIGEFFLGDSL